MHEANATTGRTNNETLRQASSCLFFVYLGMYQHGTSNQRPLRSATILDVYANMFLHADC